MQLHSSREEGQILGEKLTGASQRKVYQRGRICAEPSCGAFLSIYNGADRCSLHDAGSGRRDRGVGRRRSRVPEPVA